jgi:hypothetical protein
MGHVRVDRRPDGSPARLAAGLGLVILVTSPTVAATTSFTPADLVGQWNLHGLVTGWAAGFQGWIQGTMTCDSQGRFERQWTDSRGRTSQGSGTFQIDTDGIVTAVGSSVLLRTYHGVMNVRKDTVILTGDDSGGGSLLVVYTKSAGTFATSDLEGKWVWHALISGSEVGEAPRWWHGAVTFDANGRGVSNTPFITGAGPGEIPSPFHFRVGADGIVTELGDSPFMRGVMSAGKDMIVSVDGAVVGSTDEADLWGDILVVWQKQAPAYTLADLVGTWYLHGLVSGHYGDFTGWYHFTWLGDKQGQGGLVNGSYLNSHGETSQAAGGQISITGEGIVRMSNLPSFHGMVNVGKDLWVSTMNDGGGGDGLSIAVGRPVDEFDFNADGRVDFLDLAIFAEHWMN